jgi:predicted ATPase/class 3 adenylate cyclase
MSPEEDALPSGIVTFVFTDIEGSTRLLRRLGDAYPDVLRHHRAALGDAWLDHGGHVVDATGDSMFVAFGDASAAIAACAAGQRRLAASLPEVRVRMGVHTGLAAPRGGDYVALAVHQAARVMAAAHGGQILVSADTASRAEDLDDLELVSLGRFRLRDFDDSVELFTVANDGSERAHATVRAVPADGHNLVRVPTSFVGRGDAVDGVAELVRSGRILTLTGAGGAGKTRLATEAGLRLASAWPDGVWLVDLAPVQDATQVGPAIADAVGAPASGGERLGDVIDHLRARTAVLVLDSCEHVLRASAAAAEAVLAACGGCAIVATSREPLGVTSESVWRVDPLDRDAAIDLFLDRARRVRPDVVVDDDARAAVDAVCRRLDRLPLALELAAARVAMLSPAEVLHGLDDRFRLLRSRSADVPERQRTMKALLEWSDRLLTDDERTCLRRLALFVDGFTLASATAAVGDVDDAPELVWSLVEKSLVVADLRANGTRYRLFESVREFAADRLAESGELTAVATRLAEWHLEHVGPRHRHVRGWTRAVGVEVDNLRHLVGIVAPDRPELAHELAFTIGRFLDASHAYRDGILELTRYASTLRVATTARVSMLTTLADLHLRVGDTASAERVLADAEETRDHVGGQPEWDDVAIERTRGELDCRCGDPASAVDAARSALARGPSIRGRARMCNQLGIAALDLDDIDTAWHAFNEELDAYRLLDDEVFQASAEGNLAEVAMRKNDVAAAARHQQACLDLGVELGAPVLVALSMIVAARIAAAEAAWRTAVLVLGHAFAVFDRTGFALHDADRRLTEQVLGDARQALGRATFDATFAEGRSLEAPAAVALAVEVLTSAGREVDVRQ